MRPQALRDGDDWILNGLKMWITNGSIADVADVWAKTDDGICGFVVPLGTLGFSATVVHWKMSLRASVTSETVMVNVRLPADSVLPDVRGLRGTLSCLNEARFGIAFGAIGAARSCQQTAIDCSRSRVQLDRLFCGFKLTPKKLADMSLELGKGMLLTLHLGRLKDEHVLRSEQVSFGKFNYARQAVAIAQQC